MLSPLCFPSISYTVVLRSNLCTNTNPVVNWLAFGKLPENPVITPTSSVQVVAPSAENRYLQTVTVEAIPVTPTPGG
jgi:hypothetical protein